MISIELSMPTGHLLNGSMGAPLSWVMDEADWLLVFRL